MCVTPHKSLRVSSFQAELRKAPQERSLRHSHPPGEEPEQAGLAATSRYPDAFAGLEARNRSMNAVLIRPRTKSSSRTIRC